jgi:ferric-dicitrate binding protein FerR (iron transport regulator)
VNTKEFSDLIEKYKRGKCSMQEKNLLEKYLESFQDDHDEWVDNEMGDKKIIEEKIFSEIMMKINKRKSPVIYRLFSSASLLKKAASIAFFMVLATGILYVSGLFRPGMFWQKSDSIVWYENNTKTGEKSIIILNDGSRVFLNVDSKIKFPEQFNKTKREVYLEGEAYFEVSHDVKHPFIVHTGNLSTMVLGTKFNVSAYPEYKVVAVSLLEGKVKVSHTEKGINDNSTILKPKEELLYDIEKNVSSFGIFDSLKAVGWKDNTFKFENEQMSKVLNKLEKAFGVKFKISSQTVLDQKITIKLEKTSLQTVIEVIKSLTGLDYKTVEGNDNKIKEVVYFKSSKQ